MQRIRHLQRQSRFWYTLAVKLLGIIGGMGWEATALYYRVLNQEVQTRLGGKHSARVIIDSMDFHEIANATTKQDFQTVQSVLLASAKRLEIAGAELVLMACNTVHRLAPSIESQLTVPFLHIARASGAALKRDGHTKVGLLGTRATMESRFYRAILNQDYGIELVAPSLTMGNRVHHLIQSKLTKGVHEGAKLLDEAVDELAEAGCTASLLACTELSLAFGAPNLAVIKRGLPLYDTATLHALTAVDAMLPTTASEEH